MAMGSACLPAVREDPSPLDRHRKQAMAMGSACLPAVREDPSPLDRHRKQVMPQCEKPSSMQSSMERPRNFESMFDALHQQIEGFSRALCELEVQVKDCAEMNDRPFVPYANGATASFRQCDGPVAIRPDAHGECFFERTSLSVKAVDGDRLSIVPSLPFPKEHSGEMSLKSGYSAVADLAAQRDKAITQNTKELITTGAASPRSNGPNEVNVQKYIALHGSWEVPQYRTARSLAETMAYDVFEKTTTYRARPRDLRRKLDRLVMEPSSDFFLMWAIIEGLLLTYDLISIPASIFDPPVTTFHAVLAYLSVIFWSLDIPVSCLRGYVTKSGEVEMRFKKVSMFYIKTGFFMDACLLSIELLNFGVDNLSGSGQGQYHSMGRIAKFIRFSRLLKVAKFQRLFSSFIHRVRSNVVLALVSLSRILLGILVLSHFWACGWYGLGIADLGTQHSWVAFTLDDGMDFRDTSFAYRYTASLQWSLSMLGVGTSSIYPTNVYERLYTTVVSIVCLVSLSVMVGSTVTGMSRLQFLTAHYREQEDFLRDFMFKYRVSWPLRNRVWSFLRKATNGGKVVVAEKRVELIRNLPKTMALELRAEVYIPVLTVHPFFATYAISQADHFGMHNLVQAQAIVAKTLQSEHELFSEAENATGMLFVVGGVISYQQTIFRFEKRKDDRRSRSRVHSSTALRESVRMFPSSDAYICSNSTGNGDCEIRAGAWICEPALWLKWEHLGNAVAETQSEVMSLDAEGFRQIMTMNLPEAGRYAKEFLRYAESNKEELNDIWVALNWIQGVARNVFEPPEVFDIRKCRPVVNSAQGWSEWRPIDRRAWHRIWASHWDDSFLYKREALLSCMTAELKHDTIMVFQTLFAQNLKFAQKVTWLSSEDSDLHDARVRFLKRLILCFAVCGVKYCTQDNGTALLPWRFPLASTLCHGGRIVVRLDGVSGTEFMQFLCGAEGGWTWNASEPPAPLYVRRAATHGARLDSRTAHISEVKLKGPSAICKGHLGMDLPLGGLGNPLPPHKAGQLQVGPAGVPFKNKKTSGLFMKDYQHGHLYVRYDELGTPTIPMLTPHGARVSQVCRRASVVVHRSVKAEMQQMLLVGGTAAGPLEWTTVTDIHTLDVLASRLADAGCKSIAAKKANVHLLHRLINQNSELLLEAKGSKRLRCRGVLVLLYIEREDQAAVLVQNGVSEMSDTMADRFVDPSQTGEKSTTAAFLRARPGKESAEERFTPKVADRRVVTIPCCHNEPWVAAVSRYCQTVLQLGDAAIEKLIAECDETPGETYVVPEAEPPVSVVRHHQACCGDGLELKYDIIRLKTRIRRAHMMNFAESFLCKEPLTREKAVDLDDVLSDVGDEGTAAIRQWVWLPVAVAEGQSISGAFKPEGTRTMVLSKQRHNLSSVMFGVESSAPMKEDIFGFTHGPDGTSKATSAFGKRKWRDFRTGGESVPADLGGIRVNVSASRFDMVKDLCEELCLCKPSDRCRREQESEKNFFMEILQASSPEIDALLEGQPGLQPPQAAATTEVLTNGFEEDQAPEAQDLGEQSTGVSDDPKVEG